MTLVNEDVKAKQPKFLTLDEISEDLGVSRAIVLSAIQRGQFAGYRLGGRWVVLRTVYESWLEAVERHSQERMDAYLERLEQEAEA